MMCDGVDAIEDVPPDRWDRDAYYDRRPATPGKMVTRQGGFVENLDLFDPYFFGMSPREAVSMDPQQRLLLEVAWEAIEDAGILPAGLIHSRSGVFVGVCTQDYGTIRHRELATLDAYVGTGSGRAAAGRLAHVLGLNGPAFVVDTACSSSLVAVHLAVQAIRDGECGMALAGGVNAVLLPNLGVAFSQGGMLSPDGRCKAFDESANGFVRSEGAGLVVLQPLSRAISEKQRIYAVIRGTAVNNDGSYSTFMMPAREGQEAVLRQAYERAGVSPAEVQFVETHGTGTQAGDPAEIAALSAVLGQGRARERSCRLGAVKTNLGHTEAAAGIAGLIKTALCLHHRTLPPNLHCHNLNPAIPWDRIPFTLQTTLSSWPEDGLPARAGVNAFGISGTNAHAVLEEAPRTPARIEKRAETGVLPLSAKSPEALRATVNAYAGFLGRANDSAWDICYTASCRRTHHEYRTAVVADSIGRLRAQLEARHDEDFTPHRRWTGAVWVFSGVGSQWAGMGRALRAEAVFRDALLRCDEIIARSAGWSVIEEIDAVEAASRLDRIDIMQPAIFSVQVALAALWRSWGLEPAAVVGHSLGEFAAAHVAGALTLEDAALAVLVRSRLMHRATGNGRMLAVELTREEAAEAIGNCADLVTVAVWNSPSSTVLSGDAAALNEIREHLERRRIFSRWLKVDVACHSLQMNALASELLSGLPLLKAASASVPLYSTVTGTQVAGNTMGAEHWARNMCQPVLFAPVMETLLAEGHDVFLEVSPHPLLQAPMQQCAQSAGTTIHVHRSLQRERDDRAALLESLSCLYTLGAGVNWHALFPEGGEVVSLPAYQWQRERFWAAGRGIEAAPRHPLLQAHWESARNPGTHFWETELDLERLPYLKDHRLQGIPLVPVALYSSMALAASFEIFEPGPRVLRHVELLKPLFLTPGETRKLQLTMWSDAGTARFQISVQQAGTWTEHVRGQVEYAGVSLTGREAPDLSREGLRTRFSTEVGLEELYEAASGMGLEYGPALRSNHRVWAQGGEVMAEVQVPEATAGDSPYDRNHPALLDSITHSGYALGRNPGQRIRLPVQIVALEIHQPIEPHARLWCHSRRTYLPDGRTEQETWVYDADGRQVARDVRIQKSLEHHSPQADAAAKWLFEPRWEPKPIGRAQDRPCVSWRVVGDEEGLGARLASRLRGAFAPAIARDVTRDVGPDVTRDVEGIVYLPALARCAQETFLQANERICGGALSLIREIAESRGSAPSRLWLVTRGAHRVRREDMVALAQTALLGMGRVVANEYPQLRVTRVDLDPVESPDEVEILANELLFGDDEPEIALRGDQRHALRLESLDAGETRPLPPRRIAIEAASTASCRLESAAPGVLDQLKLRAVARRPPGDGEIEIQVLAAGLNFLDVLRVLDMLPPEAVGPAFYGMECCGRVVAVGGAVTQFQVGNEVIVRDSRVGCLRGFLTTAAAAAWLKPAHLSIEEAATMPVAYQTAYYALHHLARIRKDESVLIHSAVGGVGLAAVEIARQAGAKIFATAGSALKREYLRSLGVEHVFDSRTLDFAAEIREATCGRGVDVALNSLAGEAIPRTLSILATGGRFVEIGKRDIYGNTSLGLSPFQKNLAFFAVDLLRMSWERPEVVEDLTREIGERVANGTFPPLPCKTFSIRDAVDAFHYMAQGKHIGKIAIVFDQAELEVEAPAPAEVRGDATYLITGGFGDLGLECARFLARHGARHLVLVGRRGPITESTAKIAALRDDGVEVVEKALDVSSREQVAGLLVEIQRTMPPLRGVVHAAGTLRDGVLANMDWEQFQAVFPGKVSGAWNLHTETAGTDLDFFVLFSSAAALLGAAGQANYAAANAFLDGLAQYRQSAGLPATSIAWGAWSEIGMAARPASRGLLARPGFSGISPREGVNILERLLRHGAPHVAVLPIDWNHWAQREPEIRNSLFAGFANGADRVGSPGRAATGVADAILAAEDDSRGRELLEDYLRAQAGAVLRMPEGMLNPRVGLDRLGMDSLMAVEMKNRIERELPLTVPVVTLLQGPSVAGLAALLYSELKTVAESILAVSGMSDEKVAELLEEENIPSRRAARHS
jgi:acyl transferase domain-containing protein